MKNLDRSKSQATPQQSHAYNHAQRLQELESYKRQAEDTWQKYEEAVDEAEKFKEDAAKATAVVRKKETENRNYCSG